MNHPTHQALLSLLHTLNLAWARGGPAGQALQQALAQAAPHGLDWDSDALAAWLYGHWYQATPEAPSAPGWGRSLVPLLQAALQGSARWPRGWAALQALPDGRWLAGQGTNSRVLAAGEWANVSRPGVPPAPGDELAVPNRLAWLDEATGFWAARCTQSEPQGPLSRVYASADWPQLPRLLRTLMPLLDDWGLPWSLKCPSQAAQYGRVDTLVLYVARVHRPGLLALLGPHLPVLQAGLRPLHPPLSCPLAPGLAWADSPGNGLSFGQHRCLVLARGLRQAWPMADLPPPTPARALPCLRASLLQAGIDTDAPWLEPAPQPQAASAPDLVN